MLDVSRHFYTVTEIERLLDMMALYKLNTFHWHLVDGPGWRLEIKQYPLLTQVGAWRHGIEYGLLPWTSTAYGLDGRYGGYYTQDEIRAIVAYARARHITIVPEIEMPGHSRAALSAYPELSCFGGHYTTDSEYASPPAVYCAGKDESFLFLQNVLTEVFGLFPGKYIHIGGDEVNEENWKKCPLCQARMRSEGLKNEDELQSYFIRRMEKFINAHGKTLVGWSEICKGGLASNAVVMDWIGGGLEAARSGHDVVMCPEEYCYLDHYQSSNRVVEPKAIGGYLPLSKIYAWDPIPRGLAPEFEHHVLGAQGNLWTEYVSSPGHAQYMTFPRLCALAEVTWSPKTVRNYSSFTNRLPSHFQRFDYLGIYYRNEFGLSLYSMPTNSLTNGAVSSATNAAVRIRLAPGNGIWLKPKNTPVPGHEVDLIENLNRRGLKHVFLWAVGYSNDSFVPFIPFIHMAHEHGMTVHALCATDRSVTRDGKLSSLVLSNAIREILIFNDKHPDASLDGIQIDIESVSITNLINLVASVHVPSNIVFSAAIQTDEFHSNMEAGFGRLTRDTDLTLLVPMLYIMDDIFYRNGMPSSHFDFPHLQAKTAHLLSLLPPRASLMIGLSSYDREFLVSKSTCKIDYKELKRLGIPDGFSQFAFSSKSSYGIPHLKAIGKQLVDTFSITNLGISLYRFDYDATHWCDVLAATPSGLHEAMHSTRQGAAGDPRYIGDCFWLFHTTFDSYSHRQEGIKE